MCLQAELLDPDVSTFLTWDFYMHDSQATPVLSGTTPTFNTTVQYVVETDTFLLEYLDTKYLELELCGARGWDYEVLGTARMPLKQILDDLEVGAGEQQRTPSTVPAAVGAAGAILQQADCQHAGVVLQCLL